MKIIGRQIEVGLGVENTRGTAQSTAETWLKKISATIIERAEKVTDESTRGVLEDSVGTRVVKKWIEGDIEGNVHADAIGYLFYNLYGAVSSSNVTGTVYEHEFTLAQNITHPSLSIFAKDGGVQQKVFDTCMLSSLELSAEQDGYVTFSSSFLGANATANSDTPAYTSHSDFIGRDVTIRLADTLVGLATAPQTKVKDVSITFDTGLIDDFVLGSYSPDGIYNATMNIEGEFTKNFEDEVYKDLFLNDVYKYMQITIQGTQDIGASNNPTIDIVLNKVAVIDWSRDDSANDLVTESVSFKAFFNETDLEQSVITVKNNTEEYDQPISA